MRIEDEPGGDAGGGDDEGAPRVDSGAAQARVVR